MKYRVTLAVLTTCIVVISAVLVRDLWLQYSVPKLSFSEKNIELPLAAEQSRASLHVSVSNDGGKTLTISDIRVSCGCTKASISKNVIQPGEHADLQLEIVAPDVRSKEIVAVLDCNDPSARHAPIRIVLKREVEAFSLPGRIEFGIVNRRHLPVTQHLRIHTKHRIELGNLIVWGPNKAFQITPFRQYGPSENDFVVSVTSSATSGRSLSAITISDVAGTFTIEVPTSITVVE